MAPIHQKAVLQNEPASFFYCNPRKTLERNGTDGKICRLDDEVTNSLFSLSNSIGITIYDHGNGIIRLG